jgi:NADPH2:quinone reductase
VPTLAFSQCNCHSTITTGFDAAGIVHSVGSSVPAGAFKLGEEVWLLGSTVPSHSNAEYLLADYRVIAPKPKTLSFEDASAMPLVGLTAWELFEQLKVGEEPGAILIINGAGGVGSMATQLARNVRGLSTVVTTASRETRYFP